MAQTIYQDLDLSFGKHPATGDILKLYDVGAAKFALKNLLLTVPGEMVDNPFFGVGLKLLQFELMTPVLKAFTRRKILGEISTHLPEIQAQEVVVDYNPDNGELVVIITYYVVGNLPLQTYRLVLERLR